MKERIVVVGGGGHAKVILDILEEVAEYDIIGFTAAANWEADLCGYRCLGSDSVLRDVFQSGIHFAFVAIGDNFRRKQCMELVRASGFRMVNAVSRRAIVSVRAQLGEGVAIMPGAVINAAAAVADGAIINTNASVDHDCMVGMCAHVAPGCAVAGGVKLGEGVFLGIGSAVIPNITIGSWSTVGAGSVVVRDLSEGVVAVGIPARELRRKTGST